MNLKRITGAITAMICAVSICVGYGTLIAEAYDYSDEMKYGEYLYYRQIDEDEDGVYDYVEITDCDMSVTEVNIPAEIDGLPVTEIGSNAFKFCRELENIIVPDSVTCIGDYAFSNCVILNNVIIPEGVKVIGHCAFSDCTNLANVNIPQSIESLDSDVFENTLVTSDQTGIVCLDKWVIDVTDETITEAVIPDGIYGICNGAFSWCEQITDVTIPESVSIIGEFAFGDPSTETSNDGRNGLTNLKNVEIQGNGLKYIGDNAFAGDILLEEINLPDSLETISSCAFSCSGIVDIEIPQNVKSIGDWSFLDCINLQKITIKNPECVIGDSPRTISTGYSFDLGIHFNGTIYGYENSTAQAYAEKYGYTFESLGAAPEFLISDVVSLQKYITNAGTLTEDKSAKYDLNGDGILNAFDVIAMKRMILGK